MIEGLKVTVIGLELRELCLKQAQFHEERAALYQKQAEAMAEAGVPLEGATYASSLTPKQSMLERVRSHQNNALELRFIAAHLHGQEPYLLDRADLTVLGIRR